MYTKSHLGIPNQPLQGDSSDSTVERATPQVEVRSSYPGRGDKLVQPLRESRLRPGTSWILSHMPRATGFGAVKLENDGWIRWGWVSPLSVLAAKVDGDLTRSACNLEATGFRAVISWPAAQQLSSSILPAVPNHTNSL